jgi:putative membrane protein
MTPTPPQADLSMVPFHLHIDVVALCAFLLFGYAYLLRTHGATYHPRPDDPPVTRRQKVLFVTGVVSYYMAVGWPLHDIAEQYLYSAHMIQHVLLGYVTIPLIFLGTPEWMARIVIGRGTLYRAYRRVARPIPAILLFNGTLAFLHWPFAVDLMLASEMLHVAVHFIFLLGPLVMWSLICSPLPEVRDISPPMKMLLLFTMTLLPTVPASFLTFGEEPVYAAYASMPRLWGISPRDDMQLAGLIMKVGVGLLLWIIIAVIFFRWVADEEAADRSHRTAPPPDDPDGDGGSRPPDPLPDLGPRPSTTWSSIR